MDLIIHKQNNNYGGNVKISGAKNSAVAILPACLLTDKLCVVHNVPDIKDVRTIIAIMKEMGHFVMYSNNTIIIKRNNEMPLVFSDKVSLYRGSYYFIGSCLAYFQKISLKSCGGCDLGQRPINYHLDALSKLGVKIKLDSYITCFGENMHNNTINLPFPSVGTTINILLLSSLIKGETIINNSAIEPEVIDVVNFLNKMGANITRNNSTFKIIGVDELNGCEHTIIPDRIEAGTYLALGAIPNINKITIFDACYEHLTSYIDILKQMGLKVKQIDNKIIVTKGNYFKSINIKSAPYPGFPSDLVPIITSILPFTDSVSTINETIFTNRFSHVNELRKLGLNINVDNNTIIINGNASYKGGICSSHDLRCSASLVIACIASGEECIIKNIDTFFRGYENPLKKLRNLGINLNLID